jgi:hypothetical protein
MELGRGLVPGLVPMILWATDSEAFGTDHFLQSSILSSDDKAL